MFFIYFSLIHCYISKHTKWFGMLFCSDIHVPQRMNPTDFTDPLAFLFPWDCHFFEHLVKYVKKYRMDKHFPDILGPQRMNPYESHYFSFSWFQSDVSISARCFGIIFCSDIQDPQGVNPTDSFYSEEMALRHVCQLVFFLIPTHAACKTCVQSSPKCL